MECTLFSPFSPPLLSLSLFTATTILLNLLPTPIIHQKIPPTSLTYGHMPSVDTPPNVGSCLGPPRLSTSLLVAKYKCRIKKRSARDCGWLHSADIYDAQWLAGTSHCAPSLFVENQPVSMFTVKATYRGETRKLSFSPDVFPSFEQLYSQVSDDFAYQEVCTEVGLALPYLFYQSSFLSFQATFFSQCNAGWSDSYWKGSPHSGRLRQEHSSL